MRHHDPEWEFHTSEGARVPWVIQTALCCALFMAFAFCSIWYFLGRLYERMSIRDECAVCGVVLRRSLLPHSKVDHKLCPKCLTKEFRSITLAFDKKTINPLRK